MTVTEVGSREFGVERALGAGGRCIGGDGAAHGFELLMAIGHPDSGGGAAAWG
jgi:hypothetical protein